MAEKNHYTMSRRILRPGDRSDRHTGYHTYTWNDTAHTERVEEEILSVTYEDGRWSKPYFDCGGGNIWMMTYTVPFFGFSNDTYYFKGTSGIDIDLRRVDIDQCPSPDGSTTRNIFADSDKCKNRTTQCITIPGLGFRRGSYKCECKDGFYFPDTSAEKKYFNGSLIEEEFEKKIMHGHIQKQRHLLNKEISLPVASGYLGNGVARCFHLQILDSGSVVRAASPALLRMIILGAFFIYCTTLVLYPIPTIITCTLRVWLREVGFSLSYGALMLKTWRISVIFRVRSAKAVKITDLDLMKRLGIIVGVFAVFLGIRTVVAPPQVIVSMTADDLKAFLCSTDWWDHAFTAMEMMFLVWGIRLCIMVRKAPSEFNESKFISMAIYNEFLLSLFLNVSMLFLQSPANPDLLFIIFFCHTQLTITLLIAIIFGSKVYLVFKGQGKGEDSISMTKPMAAKFLQRPNATNSHNMITSTSSSGQVEGDVQEEFRRLYMQLEILKDRNLRVGNKVLFAKIVAMQEAANGVTKAAPPPATTVVITEKKNNNAEVSNNSDKQNRKPSRRERKYSDGIVMKPYVNNYLANMTDKIVCATFQDDLGVATSPVNAVLSPSEETAAADGSISLRSSSTIGGVVVAGGPSGGSRISSPGSRGPVLLRSPDDGPRSILPSSAEGFHDRRPSHISLNCADKYAPSETLSCQCQSVSRENLNCCHHARRKSGTDCKSNLSEKDVRSSFGFRSAELLLRKSVSSDGTTAEISERVCRSLENLDDSATRCGAESEANGEDRSVRSAHSTPRRTQGRFREVRDPDRARAFILNNLSDRATLTEEVDCMRQGVRQVVCYPVK
ncbi:probable G-protein coupled receptor CG31760 [Palaemon carinicauda]|uniref:probable G-protein coupled receptor CG31760 n=1 Tax=Palaemon carinicauda TaxID=392227 RepID=UPI0035B682AD